jgi:hypothetical protein
VLALDLAPHVAVADLAPTIALFLASRKRQLDLRTRSLELHPGGDQRQPAPLAAPDQPLDLVSVQQQPARPLGIVVVRARRGVWRYVSVSQPHLAGVNNLQRLAELVKSHA